MELNLIDELTLLALDDEKGIFISEPIHFRYGLSGAIMLELALRNKIEIVDKKVIVKSKVNIGDELLDTYLNLIIESKKEKSLNKWIQIIGSKEKKIKTETVNKLIKKGLLTKKEGKILWVININKYPAQNSLPENKLRKRLNDIIENGKKPKINEIMLISLIDSCNLVKEVFGTEKSNIIKIKIKDIIENSEISQQINQSVKEVYDQIATIVIVT